MATGTGENVSKVVNHVQLSPPGGIAVSKLVNYVQLLSYAPPAPPLRYKRLPLSLQLGSCTFDQANRIMMYELYRSCGLDPTAPFLLALFGWLTQWTPPQTLVLTVWSEAVDEEWNILMQVMPGQVITIDASVSPEWAGDYEVMEKVITPFQGEASQLYSGGGVGAGTDSPQGSVEIANTPSQNSGTIALTLRTYNPNVFFDTSMIPSWSDVPGPWADGSY
jgi:hypothetical protein